MKNGPGFRRQPAAAGRDHGEVGIAMTVERFFADATERLKSADDDRRQHLEGGLALARSVMGSVDPLEFIESWVAPEEKHRSKFSSGS